MDLNTKPIYSHLRQNTCVQLFKIFMALPEHPEEQTVRKWCVQIELSCFNKVFDTTSLVSTIYHESIPSADFIIHYDNIVVNLLQHFNESNIEFIISKILDGSLEPAKFAIYPLYKINKQIAERILRENLQLLDQSEIKHKLSSFYKCHKCGQPCSAKPIHTSGGDEATKVILRCDPCGWEHKQR